MNMISELFRAIAQSKAWKRKQSEERAGHDKANELLLKAGFHAWEYRNPPATEMVECYRVSNGDSFEATPQQLGPYFNVAGLYWRPARPMKTIDAAGPLMVSGEL